MKSWGFMKRTWNRNLVFTGLLLLSVIILISCDIKNEVTKIDSEPESKIVNITMEDENMKVREDLEKLFENIKYTKPYKENGYGNPLITHSYGADPYAMVYNDRVYVYMTHDEYMYDAKGEISTNTYANIRSLRCISSSDLVNWTDHGVIYVGGLKGASSWANNSWAPAAIWKNINGVDKFFLYFANSANSIGVLTAESPTGPFVDELGEPIIDRETPNCANVTWLFDPAVFTDDDGKSYLYFGGGVPEGQAEMPNTARVIELGSDMISTVGEAVTIEAPFIFEDSGINKIGNTYYYSYCSNFLSRENAKGNFVPDAGEIIYMTSDNPMGPWQYQGSILKNPGYFFGTGGNNHHCMINFRDNYYIFYHTSVLQDSIGITGGYRSTHMNEVLIDSDGTINKIQGNKVGVKQIEAFDPYRLVEATTMSNNAGVTVTEEKKSSFKEPQVLSIGEISSGDWLQIRGVDFGKNGPDTLTLKYSCKGEGGVVRVTVDKLGGDAIAYAELTNTGNYSDFIEVTVPVDEVNGEHDIYFEFIGSDYHLNAWSFKPKQ
jgi:arabinoxylan arabinofuranohydrolase